MEATNAQVSEELARRDAEDIAALRLSEPFNRYWMRRLKQRRDETDRAFRFDPPAKCDFVQREVLRNLVIAYDELLNVMQADEANIKNTYRPLRAPVGV
jgi:hypothetical protein